MCSWGENKLEGLEETAPAADTGPRKEPVCLSQTGKALNITSKRVLPP